VPAKVVVLMSGGVDSSVAALRLVEESYSVIGVTMRLFSTPVKAREDSSLCCSERTVADARAVCERIGVAHHAIDVAGDFFELVIQPFVASYRKGETPNPCIRCNRVMKFGRMFRFAREIGAEFIATGHYARITKTDGEWGLFRASDHSRDQSYFLCGIPGDLLPNILFPLGEWTKDEVRRCARRHGLPVAEKAQSQEVCFAFEGDYRSLIGEDRPGKVVHIDGRVLGTHGGISRFTIGQRRGLGLGGGGDPWYVIRIVPETSTVYVGPREALERTKLVAVAPNYLAACKPGQDVEVKIRSQMEPVRASVTTADADRFKVAFDRSVTAVTPGQYAVLYDGQRVVAGGRIAF
jgi:tRNA-specific 2-thiouridylase